MYVHFCIHSSQYNPLHILNSLKSLLNQWKKEAVFYFGSIFLILQKEAPLLLSGSIYTLSIPVPQRMFQFEKQPSIVFVAALGHTQVPQRYIFMHVCC